MGTLRVILFALLSALLAPGCATGVEGGSGSEELRVPHVAALSTYSASIGTLIEVYGSDFPSRRQGRTLLVFQGTFEAADGTSHPVDVEFETNVVDSGTVRWDTFGPYRVPFGPGDRIGTFYGQLFARLVTPDDRVYDDPDPLHVTFRVEPSILVRELQPVTASCGGPVKRALGGAPYRVRVQALGFEPASFTYTIATPGLPEYEPLAVRHAATGAFDTVGEYNDFIVPPVPDDMIAYGAVLTIQSTDTSGTEHRSTFAIGVHRPLEVFYNGNVAVAEIFAPTPVSACIPGGEAGRNVDYNESMTETRSRSYSLNWNESWLMSHTVTEGSSRTIGVNETNGVGFSTTDGTAFQWRLGGETEVGGGVNIPFLVEGSFRQRINYGIENQRNHSETSSQNHETGLNASETTTETESTTETNMEGRGESFSWDVSSSETIARGFGGHVIAGTYGVFYRQTIRLLRKAALVTYNQCGAAEVVGEVDFTDWTWSPDLALGDSCPPLPASNLPPAECIISPCAGD